MPKGREKNLKETKLGPFSTYQCPIAGQMKLRNKAQTQNKICCEINWILDTNLRSRNLYCWCVTQHFLNWDQKGKKFTMKNLKSFRMSENFALYQTASPSDTWQTWIYLNAVSLILSTPAPLTNLPSNMAGAFYWDKCCVCSCSSWVNTDRKLCNQRKCHIFNPVNMCQ